MQDTAQAHSIKILICASRVRLFAMTAAAALENVVFTEWLKRSFTLVLNAMPVTIANGTRTAQYKTSENDNSGRISVQADTLVVCRETKGRGIRSRWRSFTIMVHGSYQGKYIWPKRTANGYYKPRQPQCARFTFNMQQGMNVTGLYTNSMPVRTSNRLSVYKPVTMTCGMKVSEIRPENASLCSYPKA